MKAVAAAATLSFYKRIGTVHRIRDRSFQGPAGVIEGVVIRPP